MQPFNKFSTPQRGAGFGTPQNGSDSSSGHSSDPRTSPYSPQKSLQPDSTEVITPSQVRLLADIMMKDVHIEARNGGYRTCVKVHQAMNAFLTAYANLCTRLSPLPPSTYATHPVIRGSTILSLLEEKAHHSDIDVFNKYATPPPLLFKIEAHDQTVDFRSFCYMLGLEVLQILDPDHLNYYRIVNRNGELRCIHSEMHDPGSLISRTHGVFIKLSPFDQKSGCMFSLGVVNEANRETSTEIDITLLFGQRSISPLQVVSPPSPSPMESPREGSSPSTMELPDSRETFLHDGLDLVVRLDNLRESRLYSRYTVPLVKKYLSERRLKIIDPSMFRGYPRLFLWVTRGFVPDMDQELIPTESQEDKIIRMLSQIEQTSPSTEAPALTYFNNFVQEKSKSPHFAYHFFLNAYQIAVMLKESLDSKNEKSPHDIAKNEQLKEFLHLLDYEFIHPSWQKLFPKYVQDLSKFEKPLKLASLVSQLKSHLGLYRDTPTENSIRDSLGTKLRVVGRRDNRHGYFITRELSFDHILITIKTLRSKTSVGEPESLPKVAEPIFEEIMESILRPLSMIRCGNKDKVLLLYCIRMLQQQSLTEGEVESFIPLMNRFLSLWITHQEALEEYGLHSIWQNFVRKYQARLFSAENLTLINPLLEDSLSSLNPSLLPSLAYFLDRLDKKETIHPDVLAHWALRGMFSSLGNYILSFAKSISTKEILKYLAFILSHTRNLFPDLCKILLEEIIHRDEAPALLDAKDKEVITYLVIQMIYTHDYSFLIKNEEFLKAISSHDILSYLAETPTFFDQSSEEEQLSIMGHLLETKSERLLSVIFNNYPELAYQTLKNWMVAHPRNDDSTYQFLSSLELIAKNLLGNSDWVPLLFKQNRPLTIQLTTHLILSRPPSEVAPFLEKIKVHSPALRPMILNSLLTDQQPLILSPELLPIWIEMIHSELPHIHEELLAPLLKLFENPLLSKDPSPLLLSTLISILMKFNDSATYDEALIKQILVIYLPYLSQSRPVGYIQLLENLHLDLCDQSTQIQSIWTQEIHELLPKRISLDSYISWAITQPISDGIVTQISEKLKSKKINTEQFEKLYTYFQKRPDLLLRLIILGETSQLDSSLIAPLYRKVIPTLGTLELHLRSLNRLLNGKYERALISFQIANLPKPTSLSEIETEKLLECFDKITRCDTSVKKELFNQMLSQGFFELAPSLVPILISKIAEDWILYQMDKVVTLIEAKDHSIAKGLLERPLYHEGSHPIIFINELDRFEISPSYCEFLSLLIQKTGKGFPNHFEMFPRIEKQIKRVHAHYVTEGPPVAATALYFHYFNTFIAQIISLKPDDILFLFECINGRDLLKFLPKLIPHLSLLSHSFIHKYLHMIHEVSTQPVQINQELLHKMMSRYIELSNERDSYDLLSIYSEINPDEPNLLILYGKLFSKATMSRNEDLLLLIVKVLDNRFNSPSFQKGKKALKATFETFISRTPPSDVVVALEFTKMFKTALDLDSSSIALTLMGILARQPAERRHLDTVIHLIYNIFIEFKYTFPSDQTKTIQSHFETFFKRLPLADFIRILHHLSRKLILPYSSECIKFFFQTQGNLLIRHIFDNALTVDTVPLIKLAYHYLCEEKGLNPTHAADMTASIQAKISELVIISPKSPEILSIIVTSLNLYLGLNLHIFRDTQAPATQFMRSCMPHVTGENFAFNPDRFWILSFLNILISTGQLGQINPLISAFKEYFMRLGEDELQEKELMYTFVLNHVLPHFLSPYSSIFIDTENLISMLQQIPLSLLIKKPQSISLFIDIFRMLASSYQDIKISVSGAGAATPRSLPTGHLEFLLMLISHMITPATSIESINELIRTIGGITATGILERTNESVIHLIHQLCLKSAHTIISHPDLEIKIDKSILAINAEVTPTTHIPIQALIDCFIHRLTLIVENLRVSSANLQPPIAPIDTSVITTLQHQFLFYIDNQLIKRGPRVCFTYTLPFRTIPYDYITFVEKSLLRPLLATFPPKLEEQLQMTRLIMGQAQVIRWHLEQIQDSTQAIAISRKESPYFVEINRLQDSLKESIFHFLKEMITNALRFPHAIEEIIDITGVAVFVLNHEQTSELCALAKDKILSEEIKKAKPKREIVAKVMSLIGYLGKNPFFAAEAEALQQQVVSAVPSNLLSRIFSGLRFEWPWKK